MGLVGTLIIILCEANRRGNSFILLSPLEERASVLFLIESQKSIYSSCLLGFYLFCLISAKWRGGERKSKKIKSNSQIDQTQTQQNIIQIITNNY